MKVKIPHPYIKPVHVKHAAAGLTVGGGLLEIFSQIPHVGTIVLVCAGVIAIYEPHIIRDIELESE